MVFDQAFLRPPQFGLVSEKDKNTVISFGHVGHLRSFTDRTDGRVDGRVGPFRSLDAMTGFIPGHMTW